MSDVRSVAASIPVFYLGRPWGPPTDRAEIGTALAEACHSVGFCYLTGHGVQAAVEQDVFAAARAFFRLDAGAKNALAIADSPHFRGYTPLGHELTRGRPDWREQLDLGLDEPAESVGPEDPAWRRLRGPNQWPAELPGLRGAVAAWSEAMAALALDVMSALAVGLGQPADYFDPYMRPRGDPHLKIIRYQGIEPAGHASGPDAVAAMSPAKPVPDAVAGRGQGVGWHNDSGLLTFILQDDVGGLEVRTGAGVIAAGPLPGTYLMNIGEMLQRATGGFLRATEHRVVSPPPGAERISLAYFPHPKLESTFEPVPLPGALAARQRGGENADPGDPVLQCFGDNYLKIRLRSHPDVAARHYADLRRHAPTADSAVLDRLEEQVLDQ